MQKYERFERRCTCNHLYTSLFFQCQFFLRKSLKKTATLTNPHSRMSRGKVVHAISVALAPCRSLLEPNRDLWQLSNSPMAWRGCSFSSSWSCICFLQLEHLLWSSILENISPLVQSRRTSSCTFYSSWLLRIAQGAPRLLTSRKEKSTMEIKKKEKR